MLSIKTILSLMLLGYCFGNQEVPRTEPQGGFSYNFCRYAASNIPHDEKLDKGGEDAWVASNNLLVVADGVGGWADQGVDPGLFSKSLVHDIKVKFDDDPS